MSNAVMDVAQAKRDFERGILKSFWITDNGFAGIVIVLLSETSEDVLTKARTSEPRLFKTFDAACRVLREIGFKVHMLGGK
jgi:selenophosphate synthase